MPSKYQIISELASQTARDITSKAERYTDFLVTAANNYKYSFKEQLLIHAQKPDATACGTRVRRLRTSRLSASLTR